jgi:Mlc titration factor MtfA (ptsG expression regulator)
MANDPDISLFSAERAGQLRQRAQDQITRTQRLTETASEIQAYAASLRAECAMVLDEVHFRQNTLR